VGMTDRQFVSYRRKELKNFEDMLKIAIDTNADEKLIKEIEKNIEQAKADIEA